MKTSKVAHIFPLLLTACGNPGGISDADYEKYKELGPPKLLYTCTYRGRMSIGDVKRMQNCMEKTESGNATIQDHKNAVNCVEDVMSESEDRVVVDAGYSAGVGMSSTYNKLLMAAKAKCDGEFEVLESMK